MALVLAGLALCAAAPSGAAAVTIAPSTGADVVADDGQCSLREAIQASDANAQSGVAAGECPAGSPDGADAINLAPRTYELDLTSEQDQEGGDLDIDASVTITGTAGAATTIIRVDQANDRVLEVEAGATVTITGVTIRDGATPTATTGTGISAPDGGGIRNVGNLTLVDSIVGENSTGSGTAGAPDTGENSLPGFGETGGHGGDGGGISNEAGGQLTLTRVLVAENTTGDGGAGGNGTGDPMGADLAPNGIGGTGGQGGHGGGIASASTASVTLNGVMFDSNSTGAGGNGGIGTGASRTSPAAPDGGIGRGGIGGSGGHGGALAVLSGTATVQATTFVGNGTGEGGGGGVGQGGDGADTPVADATAGPGGAAFGGAGGAAGRGGAAHFANQSTLTNVTADDNDGGPGGGGGAANAGAGGDAPETCVPVCVGGGTGGNGGNATGGAGGSGGAGGIDAGADMTLNHATVTGNAGGGGGAAGAATGGAGGAGKNGSGSAGTATNGAAGSAAAGGLVEAGGTTELKNSIVASNTPANCGGTPSDGGGNVVFGDTTCSGTPADPKLGALTDNGGFVDTRAPAADSPAVEKIAATGAGCAATDARGVPRPAGPMCDAGAVELTVGAPVPTTGAATEITQTGAKLGGTVVPNSVATTYRFEYGTTTSYGSVTPDRSAGSGSAPVPVSETVTGLTPDTTYYYRLVAVGPGGPVNGEGRIFRTAAVPSQDPGGGGDQQPGDGQTPGGDQQPGPGGDATVPPDTEAPLINLFRVAASRFAVDPKGDAETLVKTRTRFGTKFVFSLSEAARVVFTIERKGRAKYGSPRRFAMAAPAGKTHRRFSGKLGSSSLKPALYRVTIVATDLAGNSSQAKRRYFRVVAP